MRIWIDGDACPNKIKDILFRAAIRTKTPLIIVANHFLTVPPSPFIQTWRVESGFDAADKKIAENIEVNDLVITADIPLANEIINKNAIALNPRGELYSERNMKQILAMRNLNESLRDSGLLSGGNAKLNATDIRNFSNNLDKILTQYNKSSSARHGE